MRACWLPLVAACGHGVAPRADSGPCANPTFAAPHRLLAGVQPHAIAIADLDGDSHRDIVVTNALSSTTAVYFGHGDGTFEQGASARVGAQPYSIALGDLDGDGLVDVVVGNFSDLSISVDLARPGRTFAPQQLYQTPGHPQSVAIGDVDGDGLADVVTTNLDAGTVTIFRNVGGGTLAQVASPAALAGPYQVVLGDVDGDGVVDIAVADSAAGQASVLRGLGAGSFAPHVDFPAGTQPYSIALGADTIAIADNFGDSTITILSGRFPSYTTSTVSVGYQVWSVQIADMNLDGKADLVAAEAADAMHPSADAVELALGNGDGTFQPPLAFTACARPVGLAVGDLDGDGRPDVAVACEGDNAIAVLLATCGP